MEKLYPNDYDPIQGSMKDAVKACIQCGRCSSGCLAGFQSSDSPRKVMRLLQWGLAKEAMDSPFLRLCIQCINCTEHCPAKVDVAGIIRKLVRNSFVEEH